MNEVEIFLKAMGDVISSNTVIARKILEKTERIEKEREKVKRELFEFRKEMPQISDEVHKVIELKEAFDKKIKEIENRLNTFENLQPASNEKFAIEINEIKKRMSEAEANEIQLRKKLILLKK